MVAAISIKCKNFKRKGCKCAKGAIEKAASILHPDWVISALAILIRMR